MGEFCTSPEGMETLLMSLNFGNYFLHFDLFPPLRSSQAISLQCPGINSISSFASCSKTVACMFLGELKETNVLRWDLGFCGLPVITTESTPIVSWARKLCQWASVYNTRTLAHFHGTQTLVQLVTPLFQKKKCPLREGDRDYIWNSWTSAENCTLLANFCWLFVSVFYYWIHTCMPFISV